MRRGGLRAAFASRNRWHILYALFIRFVSLVLLTVLCVLMFYMIKDALPTYLGTDPPFFATRWDLMGMQDGVGAYLYATCMTTLGALVLAIPTAISTAVFINEYASKRWARLLRRLIRISATMPGILYGLLAVTVMLPVFNGRAIGASGGAATVVLAIMILPTMLYISDAALRSISDKLLQSSLAMGASRSQTIRRIILPKAKWGLLAAIAIACLRALSEGLMLALVSGNIPVSWGRVQDFWQHGVSTLATHITRTITLPSPGGLDYGTLFGMALLLAAIALAVRSVVDWLLRKAGNE